MPATNMNRSKDIVDAAKVEGRFLCFGHVERDVTLLANLLLVFGVASACLAGVGRAARNVRVALGSWFDALPDDLEADVIVSNPPYVAVGSADLEANVGEWEPDGALFAGVDGLDDYRVIVPGAIEYLRPHGWLVLEIGYDQGPAVSALLEQQGYQQIEVRQDLAKLNRVVLAQRPT